MKLKERILSWMLKMRLFLLRYRCNKATIGALCFLSICIIIVLLGTDQAIRSSYIQSQVLRTSEPQDCTFCFHSASVYWHQTSNLFNTLRTKPQCLNATDVSMTYVEGNEPQSFVTEIFTRRTTPYPWYLKLTCTGYWVSSDIEAMFEYSNLPISQSEWTTKDPQQRTDFLRVSEFIRRQLGISPPNPAYLKLNESNDHRVLLVSRTRTTRTTKRVFRNESALKSVLESTHFRVAVVDFSKLSLKAQIENLLHPFPSFIIMAHGSALGNLLYLDPLTVSRTNIIEICPPYTHCVCPGDAFTTMCPWYFYSRLRPLLDINYYAYAVEDGQLNCEQYCEGNKGLIALDHQSKKQRAARRRVRDVNFITVSGQALRNMMELILQSTDRDNEYDIRDHIIIHRMDFGDKIRRDFADLNHDGLLEGKFEAIKIPSTSD